MKKTTSPRQSTPAEPRPPANAHSLRRTDLAYVELASSELARDINRDVVLELVRARQPIARSDLARASGLAPSTVSAIIGQLIEEGWIVEGGLLRRAPGRRPTMLSLSETKVILAVDVRPDRALVAVVDLNGRLLSQESIVISTVVERAVQHLIASLRRMMEQHPDKSFEGVGLSMPGRVDPVTQRLILAPNLHWAGYDIAGEMEAALGLKVEIENEANACLVAEVWSGRLDGVRNAVLVAISEGIGTAILANGQMITGHGGLAGEFGHVSLDPNGPLCGCGRTGCWEMYASTRAAVRYFREHTGGHLEDMTPQRLLMLAGDDDPAALDALTRQSECLAQGLQIITLALAPEVILFTGDLTSAWQRFESIIADKLKRELALPQHGKPPRLMTTMNPELARLRGAAALVLQRHSGYHRSHQPGQSRHR